MANLSDLPNEIIELILKDQNISYIDVCHFGRTNSRCWNLVNRCNLIWKSKFEQMWPGLAARVYKNKKEVDYKEAFMFRLKLGRETMANVQAMSAKYITCEELWEEHYEVFDNLVLSATDTTVASYFIMDELMRCIHHENRNTNLTNKYYCEKIVKRTKQALLKKKIEEYKNLPPEKQLLENAAVLIAQWCQPLEEITRKDIASRLDAIADKVLEAIKAEFGDQHPALCVSSELRDNWRIHNISDNHYDPYKSRQIIEIISKVLFKDLGFYGNSDMYYSPENSYINKVLEHTRGIPITLSIVYESVARRVGIKCDPVSFPGHFLLRWRDSYREDSQAQTFYLDIYNGGVFLGRNSCPRFMNLGRCPMGNISNYGPATAVEVMERMATNLEVAGRQRTVMDSRMLGLRSALELRHVISPDNISCIMHLGRFYMDRNMDVLEVVHSLRNLTNLDLRDLGQVSHFDRLLSEYNFIVCHEQNNAKAKEREVTYNRRTVEDGLSVRFAVGMIMRHKRYYYTCVIFGWDSVCKASQEWMRQMHVAGLERKETQPFYHVLVYDGSVRYAAEENLQVETDPHRKWVDHYQIGRYFEEFCDDYYSMNKETREKYPKDHLIVEEFLKRDIMA
ncbi:F-box only protein 21-like [Macrosteles quadrilineatus]|uniref:F-box only protein 21-like n=1 Tax=Macrosteles quadrilineatus TaxID=74068 RepID=UPI0023E1326C|nr:F-box only protein 21-like [Macrosteles quadrilineatus]